MAKKKVVTGFVIQNSATPGAQSATGTSTARSQAAAGRNRSKSKSVSRVGSREVATKGKDAKEKFFMLRAMDRLGEVADDHAVLATGVAVIAGVQASNRLIDPAVTYVKDVIKGEGGKKVTEAASDEVKGAFSLGDVGSFLSSAIGSLK
jgi:hypothetical protein